jgi:hypothetical protein
LPVVSLPRAFTSVAAARVIEVAAVSGLVNVTAPKSESKVKLFVVIVPRTASLSVDPERMVTEFVPLRVPPTVTPRPAAELAVRVMSLALMIKLAPKF